MINRKKRVKMKRFTAVLLLLMIAALSACGSKGPELPDETQNTEFSTSNSKQTEEAGKNIDENESSDCKLGTTPEETVTIFLNALANQDVDTMLKCCYIEDYYKQFSFKKHIERVGALSPLNGIAPTEYTYYQDLVTYERYAAFARAIRYFTDSLLVPYSSDKRYQDYIDGYIIPITEIDSAWIEEFINTVNPSQLQFLKIQSIDANNPSIQSEAIIQNILFHTYGATNCVERTALIELNGSLFLKGFTLVKIDEYWQIAQLSALTFREDPRGMATLVESVEEYIEIIE